MTTLQTPHLHPIAPRQPLRAGEAIDADAFEQIRRRMCLRYCKWDPQVGDVATLARFPIVLSRPTWHHLAAAAEELAAETLELEHRVIERPDLHAALGLARRLRRVLQNATRNTITPAALRVMRFDFHPTQNGWQISEVNSDVPGGFTESSAFPQLLARHTVGAFPVGDPAEAYVDALLEGSSGRAGDIALLSAAGFIEDHQVVANFARFLCERGVRAVLTQPQHLNWLKGQAHFATPRHTGPVAAIVRFYQGEWLSRLPRRVGWQHYFAGGLTPVANPGVAILTESKRLPLVWDKLGVKIRAWPRFLPETCEPRDAPWRRDDAWLIKAAFCNTGDAVFQRNSTPSKQWRRTRLDVVFNPRSWIAQRRFDASPIDTPDGKRFACIGVYVINGRACGAYGRIAPQPIIRYDATDAAVLVESEATP